MKGFHQRSAQYEQILKKNEQMFALLAITAALCPASLSGLHETVLNLLQDKCACFSYWNKYAWNVVLACHVQHKGD